MAAFEHEFIQVKVAPLGRVISHIVLRRGARISDALEAIVTDRAFEVSDLRLNGTPAPIGATIRNGDIITLIPSAVRWGAAHTIAREETVHKTEIKVTEPVTKAEPERKSRFECIIE